MMGKGTWNSCTAMLKNLWREPHEKAVTIVMIVEEILKFLTDMGIEEKRQKKSKEEHSFS